MQKTIKVYVKTFGCSLNVNDSEKIKGILNTNSDIEIVNNQEKADIEIINSCTVKNVAEEKLYREIRLAESKGIKVIVAGCVPQAEKSLQFSKLKNYSMFGPNNINNAIDVVNSTINKNVKILLDDNHKKDKLLIPEIKKNDFIAIIPISEGCIGNCNYCKTKQARGNLSSYPISKILKIIKKHLNNNVKEIWLTAQDTSCYGIDINTNLVELVKQIIAIPNDFKIRVGMGNPNSFLEIIDDYLELFNSKKLHNFFHIPVQSGSDKVLKDMNRFYLIEDFKKLITKIKNKLPNACIGTDIIVGYPTESEENFNESVKLIKWLKPDMLNISRMWLRIGTTAQKKYKQLPTKLIKERSQIMTQLFHELLDDNKDKWEKWSGKVLITEKGKDDCFIGKNESYKQVIIHSNNIKIGDIVKCSAEKVGRFEITASIE